MKLVFSDPVVVARGPESATAGWGVYQFPSVGRTDDGILTYSFSDSADSERAYGSEPGFRISKDGGRTWESARAADYANSTMIKLDNGDRIGFTSWASIPLDGLKLPDPIGKTWLGHTIYRMDEVDEDICAHTWHIKRIKAGENEAKDEAVVLNWPYMICRSTQGVFVPPSVRGRLRKAPDGTLWMPHYYLAGTNPNNGGLVPFLCNYLFRSTDNGHTWDMTNCLLYDPDTDWDPLAYAYEGYGENDITFCPDGSMIRLIRTDGCFPRKGPCLFTRSVDGGYTWSKPVNFDDRGVWPCLLTLGCGVTLASYGRPSIRVRATSDPSCLKWDDPIEVLHSEDKPSAVKGDVRGHASCCYTNMMALDDHTAAFVYSDFNVKDEKGVARKTMMYRTITVQD